MLRKTLPLRTPRPSPSAPAPFHFAIIASQYNGRYVNSLLRAARTTLQQAGAKTLRVFRVPGAFEIPAVAAQLARQTHPRFDAILCLGVILRGETTHADHIGRGVTEALIQLQILEATPMIHEVLLLENEDQARVRCLDPAHNRGHEAAQTALHMAALMRRLRTPARLTSP